MTGIDHVETSWSNLAIGRGRRNNSESLILLLFMHLPNVILLLSWHDLIRWRSMPVQEEVSLPFSLPSLQTTLFE